jgi:hypothetical protein
MNALETSLRRNTAQETPAQSATPTQSLRTYTQEEVTDILQKAIAHKHTRLAQADLEAALKDTTEQFSDASHTDASLYDMARGIDVDEADIAHVIRTLPTRKNLLSLLTIENATPHQTLDIYTEDILSLLRSRVPGARFTASYVEEDLDVISDAYDPAMRIDRRDTVVVSPWYLFGGKRVKRVRTPVAKVRITQEFDPVCIDLFDAKIAIACGDALKQRETYTLDRMPKITYDLPLPKR